jgi:hypothetical protein
MTELERALTALGRAVEIPETPDLAPAVIRQLARRTRRPPRRRLALAVACILIALLAATLAIPDARSAFLRILHIGGEDIQLVDELPEVGAQPQLGFVLGQRVSLARAERDAGFDLRELDERPDRVYLGEHGTVWFLYGTPEKVRLLIAQTRLLSLDRDLMFKKVVPSETHVEVVSVGGAQGFFLSGGPHVVLLVDERGRVVEESARLAQDVLVWARGGVSYRLEGDLTREEALELARSLH